MGDALSTSTPFAFGLWFMLRINHLLPRLHVRVFVGGGCDVRSLRTNVPVPVPRKECKDGLAGVRGTCRSTYSSKQ